MYEELIEQAITGNTKAFSELILSYKNDMYKMAYARLNNIEDINDAIQECILKAYKNIKKIKSPSSFKPWLLKILINECNKIYIQKNKHKHISIEDINNKINDYSILATENIEFYDILNVLNTDERTIILLYYSERYKIKEISEIIQMNENTIKTKLARARSKLKKLLKEDKKHGFI